MGSCCSRDEAPQSGENPQKAVSLNPEIASKASGTAMEVAKLPHNCETILKDADSAIDNSSAKKLYNQLKAGVFLNQKRKKYWVDEKSNSNCFMIFARDLSITWAEDKSYWIWPSLEETSDVSVDVAELLRVCWLDIQGKFETVKLSPGIVYEVVFVVIVRNNASGWEVPVNFTLTLPDGNTREHQENLMEKPREQWIEIPAGEFRTSPAQTGDIQFALYERGGHWKEGLIIKGVSIRPKN